MHLMDSVEEIIADKLEVISQEFSSRDDDADDEAIELVEDLKEMILDGLDEYIESIADRVRNSQYARMGYRIH